MYTLTFLSNLNELGSFKQELNVSLEMKDLVICLEVHRKHFSHTAMDLKGNETMCDLFCTVFLLL